MYWFIGVVGIAILVGLSIWVFTSWRFKATTIGQQHSQCVQELQEEDITVSDQTGNKNATSTTTRSTPSTPSNPNTTSNTNPSTASSMAQKPLPFVQVGGSENGVLGTTSIQEQASRILSRIGTVRPESLASREAFMRGVLPRAKQSRYMIPIQLDSHQPLGK